MLRPVGNLERFSTVRHSLGFYRCVANTAKYSIEAAPDDLPSIIEAAVAKVVLRHPPLCCGVINEDKKDPAFIRLDFIDLSKRIEYRNIDASTTEDYDRGLLELIEHQHGQLWPGLHCQPGWKVIIVHANRHASLERPAFDAIFAYHHAFADGLSGMVFHRSMLEALNGPGIAALLDSHTLKVPSSTTLKPAVEKIVDFKISWPFFFKAIWAELRPKWLFPDTNPPWAGEICSPLPIESYRTRIKLIALPPELVSSVLVSCREQRATITGVIHGIIVASLASHVSIATSFNSITPFSLRHLTGLSTTKEMGNQVSGLSYRYTAETLSAIRAARTSDQVTEEIWNIARDFRGSMSAEIARLPNDNLVGMLPYVSDIHGMFTSRMGKPRSDTYEVSNIGTLENEDSDGEWKIERVVFTQSGMGTGPAMSFNVASVVGKPLTISVTWLQGVVEEELVKKVTEDLDFTLKAMGKEKEIVLGL